jgi:hypothetical protein
MLSSLLSNIYETIPLESDICEHEIIKSLIFIHIIFKKQQIIDIFTVLWY